MQAAWLAELRRRNVHRVVIAYLAVAWLLAQVADFLADAFDSPAWILRALVIVLLLGLPAAIAIAWFFEWTPVGLVREEPAPRGAALRLRPHRRFDLAIAALLAAALGYFAATHEWRAGETQLPPTAGRATLAVLPFKPVVATDRDEALEFGMADTLILRLSGIAGIAVSPLSSVRRYSALDSDALAAGRELGVRSVLDGSVQRSGERLRVTARLLSVDDGRQLWSGRFDEQYTDIFAVQDSIADRVTAALAVQLSSVEQQRLARRPTSDTVAYDLFLKGRYHWNRRSSPVDLQKAIDYYSQAVARDPQFALAYSGLADALAVQAVFAARQPRDVYPAALQAAERALQLDPDLAEAHATRGHIRLNFLHDWPAALEDFDEAIRHDPRYPMARVWRGFWLLFVGRTDEGIAELATAVELEPSSMPQVVTYARGLYSARRHGEAAAALERVVEVEPQNMLARALLASVYIELGRFDEALALASDVAGKSPGGYSVAAVALARAGRTDEARAALNRLVELAQHRYVPAYDIASVHAALGDADQAFQWLDRAFAEPSALLGNLRADPVMDPLRGDPRYREVERRLRLPEP
ncbi:adenylate cyclase protein [sediment metagenome]|uniref:Adenylate cyclase protein n=1 Tax=sediment metagenome TaxID=749907 RepID=D9PKV0_9ZZZZ